MIILLPRLWSLTVRLQLFFVETSWTIRVAVTNPNMQDHGLEKVEILQYELRLDNLKTGANHIQPILSNTERRIGDFSSHQEVSASITL